MHRLWDITHDPVVIEEGNYTANQLFTIKVAYDWFWSPARDFTVKIYSRHNGTELQDFRGNTNMLYADGREPSEFTFVKPTEPQYYRDLAGMAVAMGVTAGVGFWTFT